MSDLISRQGVLKILTDISYNHCPTAQASEAIDLAKTMVAVMPDAEPGRKTGKWIYGEHDVAMCDGYWCDKCGFFVPWDYKHKSIDFINDYHFCPSCGTKMEGNG